MDHQQELQNRQILLIHRKINRLGVVVRPMLALLLALLVTVIYKIWPMLDWWTIGLFMVALVIALLAIGQIGIPDNK